MPSSRQPAAFEHRPGTRDQELGTALSERHAIVIGTGITGLASAFVLAKRGARVTMLERDAEPPTESAAEAFVSWQRRGAPQVRHSHAFLGRLRSLLRDRHPELLQGLLEAGARELRMRTAPIHCTAAAARRSSFTPSYSATR